MTAPTLYGIGIGPGDPELITLRGLRLLRESSTVFVPATAPGRSYARSIAGCHIDEARQQVIELVCPPFRDRAALLARWAELAEDVAIRLSDGGTGVFLTEGDPSLYSTFQYLRLALAQNHPRIRIEVVPGVTSACAAAAAAGVPLAMWDECVALVPGTADEQQVHTALHSFETAVLLKPRAALPLLRQALAAAPDHEVTLARRVGRPEEVIVHGNAAVDQAADDYFSLLIVRRAAQPAPSVTRSPTEPADD